MYIAFEGIDGSGKSTLSDRLAEALAERGVTVFQKGINSSRGLPASCVMIVFATSTVCSRS